MLADSDKWSSYASGEDLNKLVFGTHSKRRALSHRQFVMMGNTIYLSTSDRVILVQFRACSGYNVIFVSV
jgi:hypothetical protein